MLFVGMLSFQLAGALILLLNGLKGTEDAVIKNCFPGSNIVERDEHDNCTIPREQLRKSAHKIYLNIVAFGDLVLGYLLAAFSPASSYGILCTVSNIAVVTIILLVAEFYLSRLVANVIYAKDRLTSYSELKKNGVDTAITKTELDDLCE